MHCSEYLSFLVFFLGGIGGVIKLWKVLSYKFFLFVLWGGLWDSCVLNNF